MSEPKTYRKTATVTAFVTSEPGTIDTPEGVMSYEAGDYIVTDVPPTHSWPVKREVFERTHALVSEPSEKDYELAHTLVFSGRANPDVAVARALAAAREEGRAAGDAAGFERGRDAVLNMTRPWSLPATLKRLREAAAHLLRVHDCDHHGYEEVGYAMEAASGIEAMLPPFRPLPAAPQEPAPTTEPCKACGGIGAVNASEAAPMGEECPRCSGEGVAPSQDGERKDGEQ